MMFNIADISNINRGIISSERKLTILAIHGAEITKKQTPLVCFA